MRTAEKEEIEEVLDQITKENGLLKEKADRADVLAEVIQELMPDDEWPHLQTWILLSLFHHTAQIHSVAHHFYHCIIFDLIQNAVLSEVFL